MSGPYAYQGLGANIAGHKAASQSPIAVNNSGCRYVDNKNTITTELTMIIKI